MSNVKIKNENLPQRCEICHQSDQYNPELNVCRRCESLDNVPKKPIEPSSRLLFKNYFGRRNNLFSKKQVLLLVSIGIIPITLTIILFDYIQPIIESILNHIGYFIILLIPLIFLAVFIIPIIMLVIWKLRQSDE